MTTINSSSDTPSGLLLDFSTVSLLSVYKPKIVNVENFHVMPRQYRAFVCVRSQSGKASGTKEGRPLGANLSSWSKLFHFELCTNISDPLII